MALAPFAADVPRDTSVRIESQRRAIVEGRFKPFSGRLVDSEGRVRQERGSMTDEEISRMSWFVQGVVGALK